MTFILLFSIAIILLIPGIIMAVLPLPGTLYMFMVAVVFAYLDSFAHMNSTEISILAIITALTLLVDFFSGIVGAKWSGASWTSILWGLLGLIVGTAVIPIPIFGSLAGMFIAILGSEWFRTKDARKARQAATGSLLGWLAGTSFKLIAAVAFLILFIVFVAV